MGKDSLGKSPGDFGTLKYEGSSSVRAFRSSGGGIGLIFLDAEALGGEVDEGFMDKSWG